MTSTVKRLLLIFLALVAPGCAALAQLGIAGAGAGGGTNGGHRAPAQGGIYTGTECAPYQTGDTRRNMVFDTYDDQKHPIFKGNRQAKLTPAESAIFVSCVDSTDLGGIERTEAIIADHYDFDDRHFDHLRASAMVIDCALNAGCSVQTSRDVLGMIAGYARRIDPAAADAAFASANASAPLRQAFTAKLAWAREVIAARVKELDPRRRELWVDIPEQVWSERQEYFKRYAQLYAALDPLLAAANSTGDATVATKIRALRQRYLDACKVEGCLFTPFILETTRALELIAVRQRAVPEALAEAKLLHDDRLESQLFSRAMLAALLPATKKEYENWQKYDRAQRSGADEASLHAMFGKVAPIQISEDGPYIVWGKKEVADITSALPDDGIESAGGNVRSVQRRGDRAVISFADIVTTLEDADCRETNKIDGIDSGGKIIYREVCTNFRTHSERKKVDPIDVPASEAVGLQSGELVSAWVSKDGRHGAIINVQRDNKLVQVRGHRLRVRETRREE